MRMSLTILAVAAALCAAAPAHAQTKVGFVDIDRVTVKAQSVTNLMSGMQGEFEKLQKDLDSRRQKIADIEADIKRTEGVMAKEEIDKKRADITRLRNEVDEIEFRAQRQVRDVEQQVLEPLRRKIVAAIEEVAREQRYDLVLTKEAVVYSTPSTDITDDVVKKLNASVEADKPGAASPSPAAASTPRSTPAVESARPAAATPKTSPTPAAGGDTGTRRRAVDRQPE